MSLSSRIIPLYVILVRQDAGDAHAAIVVCWSEAAGETGTGQGGDAWSDAESMTAQGGSRLLGAWSAGSCALRAMLAPCFGRRRPPGAAAIGTQTCAEPRNRRSVARALEALRGL